MVEDVMVIEHFKSKLNGNVYGKYWIKLNNEESHLVCRNGNDWKTIANFSGEPLNQCLVSIRPEIIIEINNNLKDRGYEI